jgi:hypothetical protein
MFREHVNRIADLVIDNEETLPAIRSKAQRQASRVNGAKSRGPVTQAGKDKVSQNALRHGLLAREFMPPGDFRNMDLLFKQIHRELVDEFKPETFTAQMDTSLLASDYLRLMRVHQLIEEICRPSDMPTEKETLDLKNLTGVEADCQIFTQLLEHYDDGTADSSMLTKSEITRAANLIIDLVQDIRSNLAEEELESQVEQEDFASQIDPLAPPASQTEQNCAIGAEPAPSDEDILREAAIAAIRSLGDRSNDRAMVMSMLTASSKRHKDRNALIHLIRYKRFCLRIWLGGREHLKKRIEQFKHKHLANLSRYTDRLELLETYASQINRSIAKRRSQLERTGS